MTTNVRPTLLVGSVNLDDAQSVFLMAGEVLGGSLRSMPDGETGKRINWYMWQEDVMGRAPFLAKTGLSKGKDHGGVDHLGMPRFGVTGDLSGARFDDLGYADAAVASYKVFTRLRDQKKIPQGIRFQVSLPTPLAPLIVMIEPDDFLRVERLYEEAMHREIDKICKAIPAPDLAFQWDVAAEVGVLEGLTMLDGRMIFADPMRDVLARLLRIATWVPNGVALGFHLCYGDYQHKHWKEPKDTGLLVELANSMLAGVTRPIDWIHLPVPRDRDDDAYFAPLETLKLPSHTQLYLGLVHYTDGVTGGKRRIETAKRHVAAFGIATECGLGRRPPETMLPVMKLMATLAAS